MSVLADRPGDEDRVFVFRDRGGEWRWRRVARNGRTVATSGEGYVNFGDCVEAAERQGVLVVLPREREGE